MQITRFGGPEVMDIVDVPEPTPGEGQKVYEVSSAGVIFADTPTTRRQPWLLRELTMPCPHGAAGQRIL